MKKFFTIFLSFLCILITPMTGFAGSKKGQTFDVNNGGGGGGTNGGCTLQQAQNKADCSIRGSLVAKCKEIETSEKYIPKEAKEGVHYRKEIKQTKEGPKEKYYLASCSAVSCGEGFWLPIYSKTDRYNPNRSMGTCHSDSEAREKCKKILKTLNIVCGEGQIPTPESILETNSGIAAKYNYPKNSYQSCFCFDTSMLKYDCGEGTGTPPTDTTNYRNLDSITAKKNTCKKDGSLFKNWRCGNKTVNEGDTFEIEDKTTCVAQWEACPPCNPVAGCDCALSVVNNECKYTTVPNQGFHIVSGENSRNPICEQTDAAKCKAKNGILDVGTRKCLCNPKIEGAQINMTTGNCECENNNQEIVNGKCVDKCPEGVSRDANGECEKCNTAIAEWDGQECKCKETGKIYNARSPIKQSTCDCPSDKPDYIDGQCVKADQQQCEVAGGQWKDEQCKCKPEDIPGTRFDIDTKKCVCEDAGKELKDNQCVVPTTCPQGATGNYPECDCGEEQEYKQESNTCVKKCPEGASLQNGKCVCTNPDYEMVKEGEVLLCKAKVKIKCPDGSDRPENGMCDCGEGKEYDKENNKCIDKTPLCPHGATGTYPNCECGEYEKYNKEKNICEEDKVKKAEEEYKKAKEKEQSLANRTLTAATTAAMGIGGMELAMGLSEQKADKDAEADMKAYLSTFRCKYTDGKSFKGGPDPIELPGGNDEKIMSYRNEYISLAKDLKERKEALGMKPGIESEEILDKAEMGLYDDENVGITSGNYASLYRATALNSEEDQAKIQAEKDKSAKRVKGGAIAVGVGAGVGILGNSLINGKLGEAIKARKEKNKEDMKKLKDKEEKTKNINIEIGPDFDEALEEYIKNYNKNKKK